mmetsp:Transcript_5145/g.15606  ORF Transcript_5145/g.15606 Transcript_5145/m.15606 type:complete len:476 (-) Transcript_5145:71-1498(-)
MSEEKMQRRNSRGASQTDSEKEPLVPSPPVKASATGKRLPFIGSPEGDGYVPKKHLFFVKLALDLFCHAGITAMCVCVTMDLLFFALPIHILYYVLGENFFRNAMTVLIDWTTPCVLCIPFSWCGCHVSTNGWTYAEDKMKAGNSLVLANHGSRVDWIIGMYVGFHGRYRRRVGFVCEGLIQYMPIVGWYRRLVCEDCFVMRSFKQDAQRITKNVENFHRTGTKRMIFLSPEGVVCDYAERDLKYINDCREFCTEQGYKPFDYVLTPRYKGLTCLSNHIKHEMVEGTGELMSTAIAYSRGGKLLNSKLLYTFPARQHADLYTIYSGILGDPTHMTLHVHPMEPFNKDSDIKTIMMKDYERKDVLMKYFHEHGHFPDPETYEHVKPNHFVLNLIFGLHFVVLFGVTGLFGLAQSTLNGCIFIFSLITFAHTIGYFFNGGTSMESVPFETGIKSILMKFMARHAQHKSKASDSEKFA